MTGRRRSAALVALLLVAGCGGDDDEGGAEASFDEGPAELTKAPTTLPLAERVFVEHVVSGTPDVRTVLGVTVVDFREGDPSDLEDFPGGRALYYADLEIENHGEQAINPLPVGRVLTVFGDNEQRFEVESLAQLAGESGVEIAAADHPDFEPCRGLDVETLEPQQAVADCEVFVLPAAVAPERIEFPAEVTVFEPDDLTPFASSKQIIWELE